MSVRSYKARGVVLNTLKYGEKGLIVHMLTDAFGRQSYMVQGVRSASRGSRMALMQPMFALEFEGLCSPKMSMHRFKEVRSGVVLQSLPFDVRKSTMALFMAEVLYRLVKESESNEELFEFVWGSVAALDALDEGVSNFHRWFISNKRRPLGFSPDNDFCPGAWLDIRDGHFTPAPPPIGAAMAPDNASILHDMLECDVRYLGEIGLNRSQRVAFLESMLSYYAYHLDAIRSVESVRILQEVF
ncbi:MAG: recombination protein O N-terminal domain-containing protein [Alistipes sp.]|nr:recombination protein O N-terminal domain-containing protein [Alistipes sp.]